MRLMMGSNSFFSGIRMDYGFGVLITDKDGYGYGMGMDCICIAGILAFAMGRLFCINSGMKRLY